MAKSSTSFKGGQSGNPGGRLAPSKQLREDARKFTTESLDRLVEWMRSDVPNASISAALAILERGHGKPVQSIKKTVTTFKRTPRDLSMEELEKRAAEEKDGPVRH